MTDRIATEDIYRDQDLPGTDQKTSILVAAKGQAIPDDYQEPKTPKK